MRGIFLILVLGLLVCNPAKALTVDIQAGQSITWTLIPTEAPFGGLYYSGTLDVTGVNINYFSPAPEPPAYDIAMGTISAGATVNDISQLPGFVSFTIVRNYLTPPGTCTFSPCTGEANFLIYDPTAQPFTVTVGASGFSQGGLIASIDVLADVEIRSAVIGSSVPEPSTWVMLLFGFGFLRATRF